MGMLVFYNTETYAMQALYSTCRAAHLQFTFASHAPGTALPLRWSAPITAASPLLLYELEHDDAGKRVGRNCLWFVSQTVRVAIK